MLLPALYLANLLVGSLALLGLRGVLTAEIREDFPQLGN